MYACSVRMMTMHILSKRELVSLLHGWSLEVFAELSNDLNGISDRQAWWQVPFGKSSNYLHSSGSILGITLHIASCKVMYAEHAFGEGKLTWKDMSSRARQIEPSFAKALTWLSEAQQLWLNSWINLNDVELSRKRKTNWGDEWETMRIIKTILEHDAYHGGQIALIRAQLPLDVPAVPPKSESELWEQHLA